MYILLVYIRVFEYTPHERALTEFELLTEHQSLHLVSNSTTCSNEAN